MTETVSSDGSSVAKPIPRPRSTKSATVSASALALHLDCSRTYVGKLEAEGVIQRQGDGFPLDASRWPICGSCGASGSNRRALRLMPNMLRQRRRCCAYGSRRRSGNWCA